MKTNPKSTKIWAIGLFFLIGVLAYPQDDNTDNEAIETSSETDQVAQWRQILSGTRLNYFHTYRSSTGGFTRVQKLDLCPQGFYNFYGEASFDMSGPKTESGTWSLQARSGSVQLVLTAENGQPGYFQLGMDNKQNILLGNRSYIPAKTGKYGPVCN
ncbi:hypothetical protein [Spirosoma endbachense]|uniref:DUF1214 domain-containing protein n=1 Tax=Spirosoma endbachense TaxID=2666025 RepID=A0A6P1VXE9_9BACT|nr:hypothetical protein [Spirosoma endbachense]QHV97314.1 hypothetical protein GJR95_20905 [Spirosoma endbachense]